MDKILWFALSFFPGSTTQLEGQAHPTQFASNDSWHSSNLAKAKSRRRHGYLSRRLRSKAAKQPRYLNAYIGQVLGGCPRVHHTPCTCARGCLFPSCFTYFVNKCYNPLGQ